MLTQTTGYAIAALGYLAAANGKSLLIRELAERSGVPESYLGKIVHQLSRTGIVLTRRGTRGGVILARPAREISLHDIAAALNDPLLQKRCMLGIGDCSDLRNCPTHDFWTVQREVHLSFLGTRSLADIGDFVQRQEREAKTKN